jgi:hypothetical protein
MLPSKVAKKTIIKTTGAAILAKVILGGDKVIGSRQISIGV